MILTSPRIASLIHSVTSQIPRSDGSIPNSWEGLTQQQRDNAVSAVRTIYSQPARTPEQLHDLWMAPYLEVGWVVGPYNIELKQHPSLVPFHQLPDSEILKDEIWSSLTEIFRPHYQP